ncbi:hypothetical protein [Asaia krungthepensis]|uniref:NADH:quinone oxidoreductase/Mrp antiporter membrane subunit domain-containing protein n=1 Tax=Asaia krungthepensis NRIC 0535 TaxID=1307925 RepID=A0ABQ0Q2C5_9PROT|nr:hypothetical protein [Asaia krungthepensis]GBQ87951.1 hypothetical protein AA0535_1411 [Asaia krungthepensis NRIC 0535]
MAETLHQAARFLVPAWPLLAACLLLLLPTARAAQSARLFSLTGLVMTLCLTPLLSGQDGLARWGCLLAGCMPFLTWHPGQKRSAACLNLLSCFVIMLALCSQRVLLVACLTTCGALILLLQETLSTARARLAWESMRLRLAGLILTLLGTSLVTLSPDPDLLRLGDLFSAVGLCLVAGLAGFASPRDEKISGPELALPDLLLCLSAVALMLRLPERQMTHLVLTLAGLAALWLCVATRHQGPRTLVALATLASASSVGPVPAMLFMSSGFALAALPGLPGPMRGWVQAALPPWPGFPALGLMLAGMMKSGITVPLLSLLAIGALASRAGLYWVLPPSSRDRSVILTLMVIGIGIPVAISVTGLSGCIWPLNWMAP